jgi:hypothetical protein
LPPFAHRGARGAGSREKQGQKQANCPAGAFELAQKHMNCERLDVCPLYAPQSTVCTATPGFLDSDRPEQEPGSLQEEIRSQFRTVLMQEAALADCG